MSQTLNQQTVECIEKFSGAMEQAEAVILKHETERVKAAEHTPRLSQMLLEAGLIREGQLDRVQEKLANHGGALEIVESLIGELKDEKQAHVQDQATSGASQGQAVSPQSLKQAAAAPTPLSNVVGRHRGYGEKSAADVAFREAIMGR